MEAYIFLYDSSIIIRAVTHQTNNAQAEAITSRMHTMSNSQLPPALKRKHTRSTPRNEIQTKEKTGEKKKEIKN
jgi:hypothetical protein